MIANGAHAWSDGTHASSCDGYRHPMTGYSYSGSTGDGVYTLDEGTTTGPFNVYCDMTTGGGGWTLVAASVNDTNMPKFGTAAVNPCVSPGPSSPCFLGAANLAAMPYRKVAWSNVGSAVDTTAPLSQMQEGGSAYAGLSAICSNDNEYFRFNNQPSEGVGWTGCVPNGVYSSQSWCNGALGPSFNLLRCADIPPEADGSARDSFDYNCSPFGRSGATCSGFYNMRHWRR